MAIITMITMVRMRTMTPLLPRISLFINAADQPANQQETRFALAVVELQVRRCRQTGFL